MIDNALLTILYYRSYAVLNLHGFSLFIGSIYNCRIILNKDVSAPPLLLSFC